MSKSMIEKEESFDRSLMSELSGKELAEARVRLMTGIDCMHVVDTDNLDACLGCMYPEGTVEYDLEMQANAELQLIERMQASVEEKFAEVEIEEVFVATKTPLDTIRETRDMLDAIDATASVDELANVVNGLAGRYPEARQLAMDLAIRRGWLNTQQVESYKRSVAV